MNRMGSGLQEAATALKQLVKYPTLRNSPREAECVPKSHSANPGWRRNTCSRSLSNAHEENHDRDERDARSPRQLKAILETISLFVLLNRPLGRPLPHNAGVRAPLRAGPHTRKSPKWRAEKDRADAVSRPLRPPRSAAPSTRGASRARSSFRTARDVTALPTK